mgnify:CR=1 FL=1
MRARFWMLIIMLTVVVSTLALAPAVGLAQTDAGACPTLVKQALTDLGQNCNRLDRNSACYGFNRVDATFAETVDETFFSQPSDRSPLVKLATIETAPLDTALERWGIALLNVQANVPNTLPGQAVTFILMGDVTVENAVPPQDALLPVEPLAVTTTIGANLRSGPGTRANVVGSVPAGTELAADGLSADVGWLRVLFKAGPAWISRSLVTSVADLDSLPVITRETRTPMQAFFFRSAPIGDPLCEETPPSLLVVQGPQNVRVDITANGADITIGSTIVLWTLPGNRLQIVVITGFARVDGVLVPAGFKITAQLSEDGRTIIGPWGPPEPLDDQDLEWLGPLETLPAELLHYPIILPLPEEIQALLASLFSSPPGGLNGPSGGFSGLAAGRADCSNFRPTSPLDGLPYGTATFYWDPAPGATSYQVNVYNERGERVASFSTEAPNTSLNGDVAAAAGSGFSFSWEVIALVGSQVACGSGPVTLFREAPPPAPPPQPTLTPQQICEQQPGCFWEGECYCFSETTEPPAE